eukprot:Hpha_TRINITY_DN15488_c3_g10::TRINITY_DN15488_c3_g10_i1::g.175615::m.175615
MQLPFVDPRGHHPVLSPVFGQQLRPPQLHPVVPHQLHSLLPCHNLALLLTHLLAQLLLLPSQDTVRHGLLPQQRLVVALPGELQPPFHKLQRALRLFDGVACLGGPEAALDIRLQLQHVLAVGDTMTVVLEIQVDLSPVCKQSSMHGHVGCLGVHALSVELQRRAPRALWPRGSRRRLSAQHLLCHLHSLIALKLASLCKLIGRDVIVHDVLQRSELGVDLTRPVRDFLHEKGELAPAVLVVEAAAPLRHFLALGNGGERSPLLELLPRDVVHVLALHLDLLLGQGIDALPDLLALTAHPSTYFPPPRGLRKSLGKKVQKL